MVARDWGSYYASKVQYRDGITSVNDVNDGWALIYTWVTLAVTGTFYPQTGDGTDAESNPDCHGYRHRHPNFRRSRTCNWAAIASAMGRWHNLMIGDTIFPTLLVTRLRVMREAWPLV